MSVDFFLKKTIVVKKINAEKKILERLEKGKLS